MLIHGDHKCMSNKVLNADTQNKQTKLGRDRPLHLPPPEKMDQQQKKQKNWSGLSPSTISCSGEPKFVIKQLAY